MKIVTANKTIFLADDSPAAVKIAQGFDFTVDADNKITVLATSAATKNRYQLARDIQRATTIQDLKVVLLRMTEFIDGVL